MHAADQRGPVAVAAGERYERVVHGADGIEDQPARLRLGTAEFETVVVDAADSADEPGVHIIHRETGAKGTAGAQQAEGGLFQAIAAIDSEAFGEPGERLADVGIGQFEAERDGAVVGIEQKHQEKFAIEVAEVNYAGRSAGGAPGRRMFGTAVLLDVGLREGDFHAARSHRKVARCHGELPARTVELNAAVVDAGDFSEQPAIVGEDIAAEDGAAPAVAEEVGAAEAVEADGAGVADEPFCGGYECARPGHFAIVDRC